MRQQRKDILFHLRTITTQSARLAPLKAHLFSAQALLIALTQDLTPFKRLTYNRLIDEFLPTNPAKYFVVERFIALGPRER
jgi:hypothetical protein